MSEAVVDKIPGALLGDAASRSVGYGHDPLRVLHVHSGNLYGGVETLLSTLAAYRHLCPEMKPDFALCFENRLSEELRAKDVTVHLLGETRISKPLTVMRARRTLSELLRRERFDLVICHSAWSQTLFGPVARASQLPLVVWLHDVTSGRNWLDRWARRTEPDLILCNSQFTTESLNGRYPGVRAEVVYCPVAPPERSYSNADRDAMRASLQTAADVVVIIQVSRMETWKGQVVLLEALSRLRDLPGWVCWQVGGAQRPHEFRYVKELVETATRLGIADRVHFLGQRSDVFRLLHAADIHCQPNTEPEPFGITFIEALYAGLPVVATAVGGALEIVDDTCGVLVPPNNASALAVALRRFIENRTVRLNLATTGPTRARQLCNPVTQMRQLYELFTSAVRREVAI